MRLSIGAVAILFVSVVGCSRNAPTGKTVLSTKPVPKEPSVVFLISEDPSNYEAHRTVPAFAQTLAKQGLICRVIQGEGQPNAFRFPGLETAGDADLLVIFFRRRALPPDQLDVIRARLQAGKPLVGIRTANHAFSVNEEPAAGHAKWWEFVPEVLGCENRGYGPEQLGTDVMVAPGAAGHVILSGIEPQSWHSSGSLYLVRPLVDPQAIVLLTGTAGEKTEPIAWTRMHGSSHVFYTSLGHPSDFEQPQFRILLANAIRWALAQPVQPGTRPTTRPDA